MPLVITSAWSFFKSAFQDAINQCVPIFKARKKKNLYMSAAAFELSKKKNKLWKKFTFTGNSSDLSGLKKFKMNLGS